MSRDEIPETRHRQITSDRTQILRLLETRGVREVARGKRDLVPRARVRPTDARGARAEGIAAHVGPGGEGGRE